MFTAAKAREKMGRAYQEHSSKPQPLEHVTFSVQSY
jgi:hypothetical protein